MILERERISSLVDRARSLVEAAGGRIPFHVTIEARMSPATFWFELQKAIVNSETSEIWAKEFVCLHADNLEPHAVIDVDYHLFFHRSLHQYKIIDIEDGKRLSYRALKQNVFSGGGEVEIIPLPAGSQLRWQGEYDFEPTKALQALAFKLYFQERFFERLRKNIKKFEDQIHK